MNNNYYQMEVFLNKIRKILIENPDLINDNLNNIIYSQLIQFNVNEKSVPLKKINKNFNTFISHFRNTNNINVFINPKWKYFCQFANGEMDINDMIKLYIPMDENHIEEGAIQLFEYIANNNIVHMSKIGSELRNDDVVVRVETIKDAKKVIDYVNNNSYIKEGLLKINPFTTNINGIGIAKDNKYSYNSVLCDNITSLIINLSKKNKLSELNVNELNRYIYSIKDINDPALNEINKQQFMNTSLINMNLENFIAFYCENNPKRSLDYALLETYNKHKDKGLLERAINKYVSTMDNTGFTRDNFARTIVSKIDSNDIDELTHNNVEEYVEYLLTEKKKNDFEYIVDAYVVTFKKYGMDWAKSAIIDFFRNNDASHISNNNNARNNLRLVENPEKYEILTDYLDPQFYPTIEELEELFFEYVNKKYALCERDKVMN